MGCLMPSNFVNFVTRTIFLKYEKRKGGGLLNFFKVFKVNFNIKADSLSET
jgi:hypothetical protein